MRFIDPDILATADGLSAGGAGFIVTVGVLLWACGWRWHRFWVVFGITLAAGLVGLTAGRSAGGQVMVVGVLMAVTAGMLALELARVLAFVTGGTAAWAAAQIVFPGAHEMWAVFLSGGLLGIVLYRLWTMMLTSFVGGVLATHGGLVLVGVLDKSFEPMTWAADHTAALNGIVVAGGLIGVVVQAKLSPVDAAAGALAFDAKSKNHKSSTPPTLSGDFDMPKAPSVAGRIFGRRNAA